jgi:site-specific DNA-methyltransferase (adenine-specific)
MKTYKQDNMTIHNADCMEIMAQYEDNYFDLCITSPPYNANMHVVNGELVPRNKSKFSKKYNDFNDSLSTEEYKKFLIENIREANRVSKLTFYNIQMLTGNKQALFLALGELSDILKEVIIWDKKNAEPAINEGFLNSEFEFILVFSDDNTKSRKINSSSFNKGELSNLWRLKKSRGVKGINHTATFPDSIPSTVFSNFGKDGMRIIDPFSGSGTTAISAHYAKMGEFVGCELDEDYYKASIERIRKETRQLELF